MLCNFSAGGQLTSRDMMRQGLLLWLKAQRLGIQKARPRALCTLSRKFMPRGCGADDCGDMGPGAWRKWLACEITAEGVRQGTHNNVDLLNGGATWKGRLGTVMPTV